MRKDRLAYFKKQLIEKQRQLTEEVGRTALYGKDQEDDSIKDLGDQANTAYTREFFFELGNGDRRLLRDVVSALQKLDDGGFGACERCGEPISENRLQALPFARHCIGCQRGIEGEGPRASAPSGSRGAGGGGRSISSSAFPAPWARRTGRRRGSGSRPSIRSSAARTSPAPMPAGRSAT